MKKIALILSCEHAVDTVPEPYSTLFLPYMEQLATHRGIDFGALDIAQCMHRSIPSQLVQASATRLLIDCNRSLNHPHSFSEITSGLSQDEKNTIIQQYYLPFRQTVITKIQQHINQGIQVWHCSIHSFTPVMNHQIRNADIGLLYDPKRPSEKNIAKKWQLELKKLAPKYKVRMNYPYLGTSDGFTSFLRKQFTDEHYVGIEVESNQALTKNAQLLYSLKNILTKSLLELIY